MNNYTSLNLPEAIRKLLSEKGGIKCLADGEIAVENDNLEALRKVLKAAFPNDNADINGNARFYEKHFWAEEAWNGFTETTTRSIPASILVRDLEEKVCDYRDFDCVNTGRVIDGKWVCSNHYSCIPKKEEKPFEWGERVWVSDGNRGWKEALFISDRDSSEYRYAAIAQGLHDVGIWKYCQREKPTPAPLRVTRQQIAEKFGVPSVEITD